MARNTIESDFRSSKMATGGHFVKKIKKNDSCVLIVIDRNVIESDFRSSKMVTGGHFVNKKSNK